MSNLKTTITEMIKHILTEVTQGEEEFAELEAARKNFVQNRGDEKPSLNSCLWWRNL